ncbi:PKD domain-containing protein [Larkinella soli]|uniref:PKD domain-containing protein n=1 Tax=Larkinella soli TaxID=1770527 RepID=UPI0013E29612|nr:PKD domain-containing protein [Larkinella soli]
MILLVGMFGCQPAVKPKPIADFAFTPVPNEPGHFKFTNKSQHADRYQWIFGDGQASTEETPTVTYHQNGIYTISLAVKNNQGADEVQKSVEVTGIPASGTVTFWTNGDNGSDVEVFVNNVLQGMITRFQPSAPTECGGDGFVSLSMPTGTYGFYAKSKTRNWTGTFTVKNGVCTTKLIAK